MNVNQVSALMGQSREEKVSSNKSNTKTNDFADLLAKKTNENSKPDQAASSTKNDKPKNEEVKKSSDENTKSEEKNTETNQAKETETEKEPVQETENTQEEVVNNEAWQAVNMMMLAVTTPQTPVTETAPEVIQNTAAPAMVKAEENAAATIIQQDELPQEQVKTVRQDALAEQKQAVVAKEAAPTDDAPAMPKVETTVKTENKVQQDESVKLSEPIVEENDVKPVQKQEAPTVAAPMAETTNLDNKGTVVINDSSSLLQRHTTQQLADKIVSQMKDGQQQFTLTLHPERLGQVTVKMIFESGHLALRVETHNQLAQNLLMGNIADLKATLENEGVLVNEVEISSYLSHDQQNDERSNQSHKEGRHMAAQILDEEGAAEEVSEENAVAEGLLNYSI